MIARILSWLFPPVLPGKIRDWHERVDLAPREEGWAGNVRRRYRDGIDRYFAENPPAFSKETLAMQHLRQIEYNTKIDLYQAGWFEEFERLQMLSLAGPPKK